MTRIQNTIKPYKLISKIRQNAAASKYITNTAFVETIKIETNTGKKGLTTVTTFWDKKNKILNRIIEKRKGKLVEKTVFTYSGNIQLQRSTIIEKFVNKKKIQTTITTENLNKEGNKPFLTRIKLMFTPNNDSSRNETLIIEELSTQKHRKYIKTTAIRSASGELSNKTIEGNTGKLKKLKKSPYLYFLNYSPKDFILSIFPHAKKLQKVANKDIAIKFKRLDKGVAASSQDFEGGKGIVTFDLSKDNKKYYLINNVHHELRHQYQRMIIDKYEERGFKGFLAAIRYPFKNKYKRLCKIEFLNYISATQDKKAYLNQFIEIDANNAGKKVKQEYFNFTYMLGEIFTKAKWLFLDN